MADKKLSNNATDRKFRTFDSSKEVLAFIARQHGDNALLGRQLRSFFTDYAPNIAALRKNVVLSVYMSGASDTLKKYSSASAGEQEAARKLAIQKVIDTFGTERALIEEVIGEFIGALGWKIGNLEDVDTSQPQQGQTASKQVQSPFERKARSIPLSTKNVTTISEILDGKKRELQFGRYEWRVLGMQTDRALLITEHIIERKQYDHQGTDITWENCSLRKYLNEEFYQGFEGQEQILIADVINTNADNYSYARMGMSKGGDSTSDKVFLLSIEEVMKFFGNYGQMQNYENSLVQRFGDDFSKERKANYQNMPWWWWLRSPGYHGSYVSYVFSDGDLSMLGYPSLHNEGGVRPALWINLRP